MNIKLDIGIFDYIYSQMEARSLEKCYAMHVATKMMSKNLVMKINLKADRENVCSRLGVSERTLYRYLEMSEKFGFCVKDGIAYRFRSISKITEEKGFLPTIVSVNIPSYDFETLLLSVRLLRIKHGEYLRKVTICTNINRSRNRDFCVRTNQPTKVGYPRMFVRFENNESHGKPRFIGTTRSESFANMHLDLVEALEKRTPLDLRTKMVLESTRNKDVAPWDFYKNTNKENGIAPKQREQIKTTKDLLNVRETERARRHRSKLGVGVFEEATDNAKDAIDFIEEDASFVEELSVSQGLTTDEYDALIAHSKYGSSEYGETIELQRRAKTLNNTDLSKINTEAFMLSVEFRRIDTARILPPDSYHKFLCCDFDLERRLGLTRMGVLLSLDRSQVSRDIKRMVELKLVKHTRRYVYVCKHKNSKSKIKSLAVVDGLIYKNNPRDNKKTKFDRLVSVSGCMLYEIQSDLEDKIGFFVIKGVATKNIGIQKTLKEYFFDERLVPSFKYKKLEEKLYVDKELSTAEERQTR